MSDDAIWLVDLINMELASLRTSMNNPKIKRETFDKLSYSSWAVLETLKAIHDYPKYIDKFVIAEILEIQLDYYIRFSNREKESCKKFAYAADMIEELMKLTGGYIYD